MKLVIAIFSIPLYSTQYALMMMVMMVMMVMMIVTMITIHGGMAEWLRRSALNLVRSTSVGSNPVDGATTHKQTTHSTFHPTRSVNEHSEVTLRTNAGHTLITANLKAEVFHPV